MQACEPTINFLCFRASLKSTYKFLFYYSVFLFLAGAPILITVYRHLMIYDSVEHVLLLVATVLWILYNFNFAFISLVAIFTVAESHSVLRGVPYGHVYSIAAGSMILAALALLFIYVVHQTEGIAVDTVGTLNIYTICLVTASLVLFVLARVLASAIHNARHKDDISMPIGTPTIEIISS